MRNQKPTRELTDIERMILHAALLSGSTLIRQGFLLKTNDNNSSGPIRPAGAGTPSQSG